jgi:hypothetical protein
MRRELLSQIAMLFRVFIQKFCTSGIMTVFNRFSGSERAIYEQRLSSKDLFNRKGLKVRAKDAKIKQCYSALCELCVIPWRSSRLMDFDF